MKRLLLGVMILAFFVVACATGDQRQGDKGWEGPVISPSSIEVPDRR